MVGLLVGSFGLGGALIAAASDRIRRRLGRGRVTGTVLASSAPGLAIIAVAPVVHVALLGSLVAGSGFRSE